MLVTMNVPSVVAADSAGGGSVDATGDAGDEGAAAAAAEAAAGTGAEGSVDEAELMRQLEVFRSIASSLKVEEWSLFGEPEEDAAENDEG